MATTKTNKTGTDTKKRVAKKRVRATARPESGATAPAAVDPFATGPSSAPKSAPVGDNINNAPTNDAELGNVAADIAEFAKAKAEWKAAEARWKALSGTLLSYSKRILLGLMVKNQSKAPSQKLVGDKSAIVTTFYVDKVLSMEGKNSGRYETLCDMFGKEIVDAEIAEFTGWTIPEKKMTDRKLMDKMKAALQDALTAEELTGLFVPTHKSRKGVVDKAAKLCGNDTEKMDLLLQLTVPTPTLKG